MILAKGGRLTPITDEDFKNRWVIENEKTESAQSFVTVLGNPPSPRDRAFLSGSLPVGPPPGCFDYVLDVLKGDHFTCTIVVWIEPATVLPRAHLYDAESQAPCFRSPKKIRHTRPR